MRFNYKGYKYIFTEKKALSSTYIYQIKNKASTYSKGFITFKDKKLVFNYFSDNR
jgi:hypothetical protein